jgi:LuxR family transcriptional regulator, maltose regulon positive regulatory protein
MYGTSEVIGCKSPAAEKLRERGAFTVLVSSQIRKSRGNLPIQIQTLGRFTVSIEDEAVRSNGKGKQRPLALLKALIALGGWEVALSQVWDCLWPDSEGDLGARNLTITVHRLRHLLRNKSALLQHDCKLTLNESVCWVDAWEFERKANTGLDLHDEKNYDGEIETRLRDALALYAGQFLVHESEESWMLARRLRLKTKFERVVSALSMQLENQERFGEAVDCCLQALERDPFNEVVYRRLMSCYFKQSETAAVVRTYRQCRDALAKGLGVPLSIETERIYLEAMRGSRHLDKTMNAAMS